MVSRKEWDKLADDFEKEVCDITRETKDDRIASLFGLLKFDPQKSVLVDLGCGLGTFLGRYGHHFRERPLDHRPVKFTKSVIFLIRGEIGVGQK